MEKYEEEVHNAWTSPTSVPYTQPAPPIALAPLVVSHDEDSSDSDQCMSTCDESPSESDSHSDMKLIPSCDGIAFGAGLESFVIIYILVKSK